MQSGNKKVKKEIVLTRTFEFENNVAKNKRKKAYSLAKALTNLPQPWAKNIRIKMETS